MLSKRVIWHQLKNKLSVLSHLLLHHSRSTQDLNSPRLTPTSWNLSSFHLPLPSSPPTLPQLHKLAQAPQWLSTPTQLGTATKLPTTLAMEPLQECTQHITRLTAGTSITMGAPLAETTGSTTLLSTAAIGMATSTGPTSCGLPEPHEIIEIILLVKNRGFVVLYLYCINK